MFGDTEDNITTTAGLNSPIVGLLGAEGSPVLKPATKPAKNNKKKPKI